MTRICTAEGKHCDLGEKRAPGTPRRRARKGERCAHFLSVCVTPCSAYKVCEISSRRRRENAPFVFLRRRLLYARVRRLLPARARKVSQSLRLLSHYSRVCICWQLGRETNRHAGKRSGPTLPTTPGRLRSLRFSPHRRAKNSTRPAAQPPLLSAPPGKKQHPAGCAACRALARSLIL